MFYDTSIRMAHAFSDHFAVKATLSYLKGTEWAAVDYRDEVTGVNDRATNPGYNGLNVYGDAIKFIKFDFNVDFDTDKLINYFNGRINDGSDKRPNSRDNLENDRYGSCRLGFGNGKKVWC